jgi:hypothetical protein
MSMGNKGSDCYFAIEWLIFLLTFSVDERVPKSSRPPQGGVAAVALAPK